MIYIALINVSFFKTYNILNYLRLTQYPPAPLAFPPSQEGVRVVPLRSSAIYGHRAYNQNLPLESISEADKKHFRRSIVNQTFYRTNNFELAEKHSPVTCADDSVL